MQAAVDLSGRPYLVHDEPRDRRADRQLRHHADPAHLGVVRRDRADRLHVRVLAGRNAHHVVEAQFKAVARALRDAVALDPRVVGVPSTKGVAVSRDGVVVLDYGSGNLRSRASGPGAGRAPRHGDRRPPRAPASRRPGRARRRRVRRVHGRAATRSGRRRVVAGAGGRRPAGAGHLRRHAGAVRARRRARGATPRASACCPARSSRLQRRVVPHMGWNTVDAARPARRCSPASSEERFYFVHSYAARCRRRTRSTSDRRARRAVRRGGRARPAAATQFHPEKSGDAGAALLANWLRTL